MAGLVAYGSSEEEDEVEEQQALKEEVQVCLIVSGTFKRPTTDCTDYRRQLNYLKYYTKLPVT